MKVVGEWSVASLIRFIVDAAWWLVIVCLAAMTGLLVLSLFVELKGDNLTMDLPVTFELNTSFHARAASVQTEAWMESARGNLRFRVRNGALFSGSMLLVLLLFGLLLAVLTQLRFLFGSLSRGLLFIPENARRIRWVGFAVIFGELTRAALVYLWSYYASLHFSAEGIRITASADCSGITILSGLAILVISEVFREGTRLHEEQSLTI